MEMDQGPLHPFPLPAGTMLILSVEGTGCACLQACNACFPEDVPACLMTAEPLYLRDPVNFSTIVFLLDSSSSLLTGFLSSILVTLPATFLDPTRLIICKV